MEMKPKGWRPPHRPVAESDTKLCVLCGALNWHKNHECFTCGWRGTFSLDAQTMHLAWQRLTDEYEEVSLAHVTARPRPRYLPAEDAALHRRWPGCAAALALWWGGLRSRRTARAAERPAEQSSRQAPPPNELGV